jgi:P27 family predicted phage terminase small subunit
MSAVIKQFPGAAVERPPEPDWRSIYTDDDDLAIASAAWKDVVTEMSAAGTLTVGNGHAIKRLVQFVVQYERASRQVAETGAVTKAKRTKVPQYSPYWIVMRQSDDSIRVAEAELGITPLRRSKAGKVNRVQKAPRAADKFLG